MFSDDARNACSGRQQLRYRICSHHLPKTRHHHSHYQRLHHPRHRCRVLRLSRWGTTRSRVKIISKHGPAMLRRRKGTIEPKREFSTLEILISNQGAVTGLEAPEQPCLSSREMRPMTIGGCWRADAQGLVQKARIFFLQAC